MMIRLLLISGLCLLYSSPWQKRNGTPIIKQSICHDIDSCWGEFTGLFPHIYTGKMMDTILLDCNQNRASKNLISDSFWTWNANKFKVKVIIDTSQVLYSNVMMRYNGKLKSSLTKCFPIFIVNLSEGRTDQSSDLLPLHLDYYDSLSGRWVEYFSDDIFRCGTSDKAIQFEKEHFILSAYPISTKGIEVRQRIFFTYSENTFYSKEFTAPLNIH